MPTRLIAAKLLAIFAIVAIGWAVGRVGWLGDGSRRGAGGDGEGRGDPSRTLASAAYFVFVPALLFRATARIDLHAMPWPALIAVFAPLLATLLGVYGWQRRARRSGREQAGAALPVAAPAVRAITAVFGNTAQVGIPLAAALFGETGLAIHLAMVSLHALVLLTVATALVELDLAHSVQAAGQKVRLTRTLLLTARNTLVHPVVLPVLAGLGWNALGLPLPGLVDDVLATLGQAVVPLCLLLIGLSLAHYGLRRGARAALWIAAVKLVLLPALVLGVATVGFGLAGMPLAVLVVMASLPVGSNALIFAQRYRTLEAETTAATVVSTLAFGVTGPLWLMLLGRFFA